MKEMEITWPDRINKDSLTAVNINGLWEELDNTAINLSWDHA